MNNKVEMLEDKPRQSQNDKKKEKCSTVTIILLILIILGLCGYIAYDKGWIFKDKTTEKMQNT